jgi:putative addiction module component (TIGR02574 family)
LVVENTGLATLRGRELAVSLARRGRYTGRTAMAALEAVLEQALKLSEKERGELVARLLDSLEADDGSPVAEGSWRAAWADEIALRVGQIRDGAVELVDGDEVFRRARARIASRR